MALRVYRTYIYTTFDSASQTREYNNNNNNEGGSVTPVRVVSTAGIYGRGATHGVNGVSLKYYERGT